MSTVKAIDIADGLVAAIGAADLGQPFTVERRWTGPLAREVVDKPLVLVVPVARDTEPAARGDWQTDWRIVLAVYAPVSGVPSRVAIDALVELQETVQEIVRGNEVIADARLVGIEVENLLDSEAVSGRGLFGSTAVLTYRTIA